MQKNARNSRLTGKLKDLVMGDVLADERTLRKFSRDRSIYEIKPLAVVCPASLEDLEKLISFAANEGLPLTPRGGGSGTAGGALGEGIVIALKRGGFLGEIQDLEVKNNQAYLTVESGVFHDSVQHFLKERGYYLPADPSSGAISQIGGNIATKASGPHALKHGSMDRFVEHLEFFTARGEHIDTSNAKAIPARIKQGLKTLSQKIRKDEKATILLKKRQGMKIASGYNMFSLLQRTSLQERVTQLLVGSVGTLGFVTRATLRSVPYDPQRATMLLYFHDLAEAGDAVCQIKEMGAAAIEIMNRDTVRVLGSKSSESNQFSEDAHMLLVEFEGQESCDRAQKVSHLLKTGKYSLARSPSVATTEMEMERLWKARKQILPAISRLGSGLRALSVVNDVGVNPHDLALFISDLQDVFKRLETPVIIYGHAGSGNLHLRPLFDVTKPGLRRRIRQTADRVYEVVFKYGGTIAAEHGMGRLRTPYLEREWGTSLFGYMKEIKAIFDPDGILNPHVMFGHRLITDNIHPELTVP